MSGCATGRCGAQPFIPGQQNAVEITVNEGCNTVDCWLQHYIIEKKLLCLLGLCDAETRRAFRYLREAECLLRRLWLADQQHVFAEGNADAFGRQLEGLTYYPESARGVLGGPENVAFDGAFGGFGGLGF